MSRYESEEGSQMEGEDEEKEEKELPEMWQVVQREQLGKLMRWVLDKGEDDEMLAAIQELHPGTGQSLLMWAVLKNKFVLVEWLVTKFKRGAFAFQHQDQINIFDRWHEMKAEREQEKLIAKEAQARGDIQPPEEEEPEPDLAQTLLDAGVSDNLGEIRKIGELGVYEGARTEQKVKHGTGQALFPNGHLYIGEYVDNKRHGMGLYVWSSVSGEGLMPMYLGEWNDNIRQGLGRMIYADGSRYYGTWLADKKHGNGRLTYASGDVYEGEFVADLKEGNGVLETCKDNSLFSGTFAEGQFLSGRWIQPNGTIYHGVFKDGKPTGRGIFIFTAAGGGGKGRQSRLSSGIQQEGHWDGTKWVVERTHALDNDPNPSFTFALSPGSPSVLVRFKETPGTYSLSDGKAKKLFEISQRPFEFFELWPTQTVGCCFRPQCRNSIIGSVIHRL